MEKSKILTALFLVAASFLFAACEGGSDNNNNLRRNAERACEYLNYDRYEYDYCIEEEMRYGSNNYDLLSDAERRCDYLRNDRYEYDYCIERELRYR